MKTSVIGFPRVGTLRELKFASEKYFRKETGAEELLKEAPCIGHKNTQTSDIKTFKYTQDSANHGCERIV